AYPGHKEKHSVLAKQAQDLVEKYHRGELVLPLSLSRFLNDWMTHHIHDEDKMMVRWLRQDGAFST
ncbi:MAG TPA: hypothetical protein VLM37_01900, partial [Fibrobacteraceae bacterium]|nr:hypothetical protein [Fibrobacteraceae bacterium]